MFVTDLDDTVYREIDYVYSGYRARKILHGRLMILRRGYGYLIPDAGLMLNGCSTSTAITRQAI